MVAFEDEIRREGLTSALEGPNRMEPGSGGGTVGMETSPPSEIRTVRPPRRHDLDALRSIAMLLGICLHVFMAYSGAHWMVVDNHKVPFLLTLVGAIHGFRMPLFFLVSGYFTAMLLERHGPWGMLKNRAARILLPLMLCLFTLIPLCKVVDFFAVMANAGHPQEPLFRMIKEGDIEGVEAFLDSHDSSIIEKPDSRLGMTPLAWSILWESDAATRLLLERGANLKVKELDAYNPMSVAAFVGRVDLLRLLVENGADPFLEPMSDTTPFTNANMDLQKTKILLWVARGRAPADMGAIEKGRQDVREYLIHLAEARPEGVSLLERPTKPKPVDALPGLMRMYFHWLDSDRFAAKVFGLEINLLRDSVFGHLWFLWFLWWLCLVNAALWRGGIIRALDSGISGGGVYWVLIVAMFLTFCLQAFMGADDDPGGIPFFVGPDLSVGLLPKPHVFLYYAVFFFFGSWYFRSGDSDARLGRHWAVTVPVALLVVFPLILATRGTSTASTVLQVFYTWLMVLGSIGLAHRLFRGENRVFRYFADASYWLYLIHLPLVVGCQWFLFYWPLPGLLKAALVLAITIPVLLASYQLMVRHTVIGRILNGKNPPRG